MGPSILAATIAAAASATDGIGLSGVGVVVAWDGHGMSDMTTTHYESLYG